MCGGEEKISRSGRCDISKRVVVRDMCQLTDMCGNRGMRGLREM